MTPGALYCPHKCGAGFVSLLLAFTVVISGCGEEKGSWVERPMEQDAIAEVVAPELGANTAAIMMSTEGNRRVEIEVTGGAADSLDWASLKQARFAADYDGRWTCGESRFIR